MKTDGGSWNEESGRQAMPLALKNLILLVGWMLKSKRDWVQYQGKTVSIAKNQREATSILGNPVLARSWRQLHTPLSLAPRV